MNVVVTGASGFIGSNVLVAWERRADLVLRPVDRDTTSEELEAALADADVVIHLAGVNRPTDPVEFERGNVGPAQVLTGVLNALGRQPLVVLASSTQATLDNPYGRSKLASENILREWAAASGAPVRIFRLPGVFGKWCRPHYNSVVATFCHRVARDLPIQVHDPGQTIDLAYVDDVIAVFEGLFAEPQAPGAGDRTVSPVYRVNLGELAAVLLGFRDSRRTLSVPDMTDPLLKKLHATYTSYLPEGSFAYDLQNRTDNRGSLAEFVKASAFGQVFVSRTLPGITRGNHFHHTKVEKFLVLEGDAVVRFRPVLGGPTHEYRVTGEDYRVVDIPPGYTHSIENTGSTVLVTLFWSTEVFDAERPDTWPLQVIE